MATHAQAIEGKGRNTIDHGLRKDLRYTVIQFDQATDGRRQRVQGVDRNRDGQTASRNNGGRRHSHAGGRRSDGQGHARNRGRSACSGSDIARINGCERVGSQRQVAGIEVCNTTNQGHRRCVEQRDSVVEVHGTGSGRATHSRTHRCRQGARGALCGGRRGRH